jgi:hypothetical protein
VVASGGHARLSGPTGIPDSIWEEWKMKFGS